MEFSHGWHFTSMSALVICNTKWQIVQTDLCPRCPLTLTSEEQQQSSFGGEGTLKANNKVSMPLSDNFWDRNTEWGLLLI